MALLKKVLGENGVECEENVLDEMLGRLNIPCDQSGVYYHHFLSILSSRAEQFKLDQVNKIAVADSEKDT